MYGIDTSPGKSEQSQRGILQTGGFETSTETARSHAFRVWRYCLGESGSVHVVVACTLVQVCELKGESERCLHELSTVWGFTGDQLNDNGPTAIVKRSRAQGGPPGNMKAAKHGVYSLQAARKGGRVDRRTKFGKAFEARKKEYVSHLGGDRLSAMELAIVEDTVWTDFYTAAYDAYLSSLKSVIRKGRPHPIVDARTKLATHRRENLKTLGLKRVSRTLSLNEIFAKPDDTPADGNGAADSTVHVESGKD